MEPEGSPIKCLLTYGPLIPLDKSCFPRPNTAEQKIKLTGIGAQSICNGASEAPGTIGRLVDWFRTLLQQKLRNCVRDDGIQILSNNSKAICMDIARLQNL